jgi:hypothetical protein
MDACMHQMLYESSSQRISQSVAQRRSPNLFGKLMRRYIRGDRTDAVRETWMKGGHAAADGVPAAAACIFRTWKALLHNGGREPNA